MKFTTGLLLSLVIAGSAAGQVAPATIKILDEIAPPGGMAQFKMILTSPQPIPSGVMDASFADGSFDGISGISLYSPSGDVAGAAVVNGGRIGVRFTSPLGTFGTTPDYPLMTVAVAVRADAIPGQQATISLNTVDSLWRNPLGASIPVEVKPGTFTVGGSVSITNVVPGGGLLPAGATVSVRGIGFTPDTKLKVAELVPASVAFVSAGEIRFTLADAAQMDGRLIKVTNRDGSSDSYFSYLRGVAAGESARPLLRRTVPVFSTATAVEALSQPVLLPALNAEYFEAVALQNPDLAAADVTVEHYSAGRILTATAKLTLASGTRVTRDLAELFGSSREPGGFLHIVATRPIQMLGLLGDERTGTVVPLPMTSLAPGGFRP